MTLAEPACGGRGDDSSGGSPGGDDGDVTVPPYGAMPPIPDGGSGGGGVPASVTSVDGLQSLATVGGSLRITGNPALVQLRDSTSLSAVEDIRELAPAQQSGPLDAVLSSGAHCGGLEQF